MHKIFLHQTWNVLGYDKQFHFCIEDLVRTTGFSMANNYKTIYYYICKWQHTAPLEMVRSLESDTVVLHWKKSDDEDKVS